MGKNSWNVVLPKKESQSKWQNFLFLCELSLKRNAIWEVRKNWQQAVNPDKTHPTPAFKTKPIELNQNDASAKYLPWNLTWGQHFSELATWPAADVNLVSLSLPLVLSTQPVSVRIDSSVLNDDENECGKSAGFFSLRFPSMLLFHPQCEFTERDRPCPSKWGCSLGRRSAPYRVTFWMG